jgi:hypothetical protein
LISVLKCGEKRSDLDLNLSWGGNKKKLTKRGEEKVEPISVLDYSVNMGRLVPNTISFDTLLERQNH